MRTVDRAHPASPGLGDGAAALVLTTGEGLRVRSVFTRTPGDFNDAVAWVRTGDRGDLPWWIEGGGYRLGSFAPQQVKQLMRDTVTYGAGAILEAARKAGVDPERLAAVCPVQPRGFFPGAIAERLGLPRALGVSTYERIAHLGGCGPIFNLVEARATGRLAPGAFAALYAQGAGFTRAAAILEVA
jgi:3-oxoacyl-[acyl-carrier-protein] synthase III